ncbi:MAG: FAD-binding oxidoreductase, partial [Desulfobacterales bacterium]|nr:FAD-binding oxidoreductase [Desulfobacterales bacterium]
MLESNVYKELEDVLGSENITQEPGILDGYAWQPALNLGREPWIPRPEAVVLPQTTQEVQDIVRICNSHKIKFKAFSTGWAAWGGPGSEGVVQIDLRRMNKIIEIDEKNMFAVVEPYVCCSQLHSEVMKKGLNCHIIGAGPNTSPLASTTSGWGNGWTGLATAYGARNPLALEWVLPNGDLLKLGSIGSDSGWISGDGPGPGLRGIMRGMMGAQGGLGVFTKCAIKLFPWNGPEKVDVEGLVLDLKAEIPKTEKIYFLFSKDHDAYADLAYEIGNAEIGYLHCKGAFGMFKVGSPKIMNKILETKLMREMLKAFKVCTFFAISASSERELEYEETVIRKIVAENNGAL